MKFTRQKELEQIMSECNSIEEWNRLVRLQNILLIEFSEKLSTIWTINAKVDKLIKELRGEQ